MRSRTPWRFLLGSVVVAGLAVPTALAGDPPNELQIDVNAFTTTVNNPPFGLDYTGSIAMSDDEDSELAGVLIDGTDQLISGMLMDFSGEIEFINGSVNGGFFDVVVLEQDGMTINQYSATIDPMSGVINTQAGQGFSIDALTYTGTFSSNHFSGVDVTDWFEDMPLDGSFIKFQFEPVSVGAGTITQDDTTDIDIFVREMNVPTDNNCLESGDRDLGNNDVFENRELVDCDCTYITGKLEKRHVPNCRPDTYIFLFDKFDNIVDQDDNSSTLGDGKASGVFGVAPIPNVDDPGATVRIGLTGRPDGIDNQFNGLFFNAPHQQIGEATVYVSYFNDMGVMIGQDDYVADFKSGLDAFRINFEVPDTTATVNVEVDNTTDMIEYCGDVDYYEIDCLPPSCDVRIKVVGGMTYDCESIPLVMGWFNKNGELVDCFTEESSDGFVFMDVISDVNGRVRLAISGAGDCDFDGLLDGAVPMARNIQTPCVELPPYHDVCGVYVFCWEILHGDTPPNKGGGGGQELLMLANGDLNLDGGVDVIDLAILINNWGWTSP